MQLLTRHRTKGPVLNTLLKWDNYAQFEGLGSSAKESVGRSSVRRSSDNQSGRRIDRAPDVLEARIGSWACCLLTCELIHVFLCLACLLTLLVLLSR
jgi:hypothetical protein